MLRRGKSIPLNRYRCAEIHCKHVFSKQGWLEVVMGLVQSGKAWPAVTYPVPVIGMNRQQSVSPQDKEGCSGGCLVGRSSSSTGRPQFPCLLTGNSVNATGELQERGPESEPH